MFHKIYQPHPDLRDFVNNIMVFDFQSDPQMSRPVMSFPPLPEYCLYFYPFETPQATYLNQNKTILLPNSILTGRQVNRIQLSMMHRNLTIKVGFQAGGLFRFLGLPMNEFFMDESLDSTDVLTKDVDFVTEQLREATSYDQMVGIVEQFLLKKRPKLKEELPIDRVLAKIIKQRGLVSVDTIAKEACLSTRQLERQFQQRVGIPPKLFTRLTRFANAWILKEHQTDMTWTRIAYECGYFDQMHFIRDFKEFAGVNPSAIENEFKNTPYSLFNPQQL